MASSAKALDSGQHGVTRVHPTTSRKRTAYTSGIDAGASRGKEPMRSASQGGCGSRYEISPRHASNTGGGYRSEEESQVGCCEGCLIFLSIIIVIFTFPFSLCVCLKVVTEYERAVIFRLGRVRGGARGPGLFFIFPCTDNIVKIDLRTVTYDVPPQEILTKDSVTVNVDAVCYFRIYEPVLSVNAVQNAHRSTQLLAQTTLRNHLGMRTLSEILSERDEIAYNLQSTLDQATDPWGIKVERVELKDVRLPHQLQRAMAAEAEASREAKAKVIAAEGEQRASKALKEAADVISLSPTALQLRYLQTLNNVAAEKNSTIIFPIPIDMMASMAKK